MKLFHVLVLAISIMAILLVMFWSVVTQPLFFTADRVDVPVVNPQTLESRVRMLSEIFPARVGAEEGESIILESSVDRL